MTVNKAYVVTDTNEDKNQWSWTVSRTIRDEQAYTYDDAIDLAGNGFYSMSLLAILSMATLSMAVDIFGFSVVVTGATCDFKLGLKETGILLSVTFIGPIVMAYPWGYLSDTQGRRKSLLIALWSSCLVSAVSAFSPDWITMAVLKLISTSFSSCAQSVTYTLLGESCSRRFRDAYMMIMSSILDFSLALYVGIAYVILNMDFSYDLGFIVFNPWRLLILVLTLPLGLGAFGILFFYESPKFLLNAGRDGEALNALAEIWTKNGGKGEYPVKKLTLKEVGNVKHKDITIWSSLWGQLVPLFRPPLLWRSLQLYFLTAVVFGTNNSYFIWFPYLAEKFIGAVYSNATFEDDGLCSIIISGYNTSSVASTNCSSKMDIGLFWSSLAQGTSFVLVLLAITRIAHRKRLLVIIILLVSSLSALGAVLIKEKITSFFMFFGLLLNELIIGIIHSYYMDLIPTSFRGMAACIGTMVARSSALSGVSLLGDFIMTHCSNTFYVCSGLMLCGVLVAFLLPKDKPRQPKLFPNKKAQPNSV